MPLNTEYNIIMDYLDDLLSKENAEKKQITDVYLRDADLVAIQARAKTYTEYLKNYVTDYKNKTHAQRIMKIWFFVLTMFLLLAIVGASSTCLVAISLKDNIKLSDIATVITAMAGAVSSFLILPKVIAENLFPSREEDKTAEVFGKMFEHDIELRGLYHITGNIEQMDDTIKNSSSDIIETKK